MKYNAMKIEYVQNRLNEIFIFYLKLLMDLIGIDVTESISKYEDDDRMLIVFAKNASCFKNGEYFAIRVGENQKNNIATVLKLIGLTDELRNILDLFFEKKYYSTVFFLKYFYPLHDKERKIIINKAYEFIGGLYDLLETENIIWEEEKNKITKFVLLKVLYDVNLFISKEKGLIEHFDDLIKKELSIEKFFKKDFPAIYSLIADSYVAQYDYNNGYKYYAQYEAFGFSSSPSLLRKKGNYWFDFAGEYEDAVRYYERGVKFSKTDYFIYMKLALSYMKVKNIWEAVDAFNIAKKILYKRIMLGVLFPREFYNLIFIELKLIEIYMDLNRYGNALTAMEEIKFIFENLNKVMFINDVLPNFSCVLTLKEEIPFDFITKIYEDIMIVTGVNNYMDKKDFEKYFK